MVGNISCSYAATSSALKPRRPNSGLNGTSEFPTNRFNTSITCTPRLQVYFQWPSYWSGYLTSTDARTSNS